MAYQINRSDGSVLTTVADGQIDQLSTDITLIGKNYSGFGEALNENFIKILENFADTRQPERPIRGQIWFDSSELKLKVYNGSAFVPVSSATISSTRPSTLGVGDLWFNDVDRQLFFFDGINTILLGPSYSEGQGLSGLIVGNVLDTLNQNRVITYLYNNGILLGIFSKDSFTPKNIIEGFSGNIIPGFNAGTLEGIKFNVTVTNSEKLGNLDASTYVRNDTSNIINGQLILTSNLGLIIGDASQAQLFVSTDGDIILANIASNKKVIINVRRGVAAEEAVSINAANRSITFYDGLIDSEVIAGGDFTVRGNFTVEGDVTTVQTANLIVEDKNILLAQVGDSSSGTDEYADGGGVILRGASDHEFIWTQASTAWNSTEHINLAPGKEFKINGVTVISSNSLGPGITSIPGVTSFGPQTSLTVDDIFVDGNTVQVTAPDTDLVLDIDGTGSLNLGFKKIINVSNPSSAQDAATKEYVDNTVQTRNLVLSIDISDGLSNFGIATLITQLAPPIEYRNGTLARVLCTIISNSSSTLNINPLVDPNKNFTEVNTPSGNAFVIGEFSFNSATIPAQSVSITRVVKTFQIISGAWTFVS
jgi:hypothetical protein